MTLYEFLRKRHLQDLVALRNLEKELPDSQLKFTVRDLRKDIQQSLAGLRRADIPK